MDQLVSVIIPCYNVEKYIERAINSIKNQSYPNLEIIAIDNNSNDRTYEKLEELKSSIKNLIVIKENRQGAPFARNKGLAIAKGSWIQFLDADDELLKDKIKHQIENFASIDNCDFIAASCKKIYFTGKENTTIVPDDNPWILLVNGKLGNTCSNLFKKDILLAIGGWNTRMKSSQEADLMFRILKNGFHVKIDNQVNTVIYQRTNGQISNMSINNQITYLNLRFLILEWISSNMEVFYSNSLNQLYKSAYNRIRLLSKFDIDLALSYYNQIPKRFTPLSFKAKILKVMIDNISYKFLKF